MAKVKAAQSSTTKLVDQKYQDQEFTAKSKTSALKSSKNYKKLYRGQGK
jgi:hypothetical protein